MPGLWAREHIVTDDNKYIMRDFMRICEAVKNGHIEPRHISTKLNLSGLFTKSVPKEVIDSLYESMRRAGIFPAMPPSAYDLDDVKMSNAADLISSRNAAAISEMSLMSAADRHDLFARLVHSWNNKRVYSYSHVFPIGGEWDTYSPAVFGRFGRF